MIIRLTTEDAVKKLDNIQVPCTRYNNSTVEEEKK